MKERSHKSQLLRIKSILQSLRTTGLFHIFGSGTLVQLVAFLSNIIIVNLVSKEEYGLFSYAANIYAMVMIMSGLGSSQTMLQFASEQFHNERKKRAIYQYALMFGIVANAFFCLIVFLVGFIYPFGVQGAQLLIFMYAALPIFQYLNEYQTIYLRCERKNKAYSLVNLLFAVLQLIFSIIGAILFGVEGFILAQYTAVIIIVVLSWKLYRIPFEMSFKGLYRKERKEFIKFSLIVSAGNGFSQLKSVASSFVLGLLMPNAALLASYNVAIKIPVALLFVPSALCVYLYPYFAEHINDAKWCLKNFYRSLVGIFIINLVITLFTIVLAEQIIVFAFGEEYRDAVGIFVIMAINFLLAGTFNTLPGNLLGAQRKFAYNLGVNVVVGSLSVILSILLIPLFSGGEGAAFAILLSTIVSGCCYTFKLISIYKSKL